MARARLIYPEFFDDPDIYKLEPVERYLLLGMLIYCADDYGRLRGDPAYLRKQIFGYDVEITTEEVQNWRDHILDVMQNIHKYQEEGESYLVFIKWFDWQKHRRYTESTLPDPSRDEPCLSDYFRRVDEIMEEKRTRSGGSQTRSDVGRTGSAVVKGSVVKRSVVKCSKVKGSEVNSCYSKTVKLYEQVIGGTLSPMIAEDLGEYGDKVSIEWMTAAFKIADERNARNWRYVKAILDRWIAEGKMSDERRSDGKQRTGGDRDPSDPRYWADA